jgi:hypothetical protein
VTIQAVEGRPLEQGSLHPCYLGAEPLALQGAKNPNLWDVGPGKLVTWGYMR